MADSIERALEPALTDRFYIGQILVRKTNDDGFVISHREDQGRGDLKLFQSTEDAIYLSKFDDGGNYRPLKTAPNLQHGWRLQLATVDDLRRSLDHFYPGRLAVFAAWKGGPLASTPLRETLDRQSGMYRVAAKISDEQVDRAVGDFCRSDGGCLRSILWKRDKAGTIASTNLPPEKFDPAFDQTTAEGRPGLATPARAAIAATGIPLLCQEPCNLLVAECRNRVKDEIEL
jgi:4Fe-4S iron-sulfur cluster binding domain/DR2241 stabilising domain